MIVVATVSGVAFALIWWLVPPLLYGDTTEAGAEANLKAVTDTRTALIAGLVGVGALLTFALNLRTHGLAEQGHITDRYTAAVGQLGAKERDVRVGGVYALKRIMEDSPRDHGAVVDVLTAFIREHARGAEAAVPGQRKSRPGADVQAALTVVGHRPHRPWAESDRVRLADTNLRGANLRGACLQHANHRYAILDDARLEGAHLEEAKMRGSKFGVAHLAGAHLDRTDLPGADLRDARNLTVQQIVAARVYSDTKLPPSLAEDESVRARIAECDAKDRTP
jgi:hypothetical protein